MTMIDDSQQGQFLAEGTPVRAPTGEKVILKEQRGDRWLADNGQTYAADQLAPLGSFGEGIAGAPPGTTQGDGPAGLIGGPS